jgi:hypothetical protein
MAKKLFTFASLLTALGAVWAYMVSDEDRFARLEKGADVILDRILPA